MKFHAYIFIILSFIVTNCVPVGADKNNTKSLKFSPAKAKTPLPEKPVFIPTTEGDKRFLSAFNILNNKCSSCHTHKENFSKFTIEDDWVNSGYIVRGDVVNSLLLKKLKLQGGNMPPNLSPELTSSEYDILKQWVSLSVAKKLEIKFSNTNIQASKNSGNLLFQYTLSKALSDDIKLNLMPTANSTLVSGNDYSVEGHILKAGTLSGSIMITISKEKLSSANEILEFQLSSNEIFIQGESKIKIQVSNEVVVKTPAQLRYEKAKLAIDAKCMTCHTDNLGKLTTESDWISNNYFIKTGDSLNSLLLKRTTQQSGNMPPQGSVALTNDEYNSIKSWIDGLLSNRPVITFSNTSYTVNNSLVTTQRVDFTLSKPLTKNVTLTLAVLSGSDLVEGTEYTLNKSIALLSGATKGSFLINFTKDSYISGKKSLNLKILEHQEVDISSNYLTVAVSSNATLKTEFRYTANSFSANKASGAIKFQYTLPKAAPKDIALTLIPTSNTNSVIKSTDYIISNNVILKGATSGFITLTPNLATLSLTSAILEFETVSSDITFLSSSKLITTITNAPVVVLTPAEIRYKNAKGILDAKCTTCHFHQGNFALLSTEDNWIKNNYYIKPSDAANSLLVKRSRIAGGDMPPVGSVDLTSVEFDTVKAWINGLTANRPILTFAKTSYSVNNSLVTSLKIDFSLSKPITKDVTLNLALLSGTDLQENTQFTLNKEIKLLSGATAGSFTINFTKDAYLMGKKYVNLKVVENQEIDIAANNLTIDVISNAILKTEFQYTANSLGANKESGVLKFLYTLPKPAEKNIILSLTPTSNTNSVIKTTDYAVSDNTILKGATSGFITLTINLATLSLTNAVLELETTSSEVTFLSSSKLKVTIANAAVVVLNPGELRFKNAKTILDAKCSSCHFHQGNFAPLITEEDWIKNNYYIKPSDATNSLLIKRSRMAGGDMPPSGSADLTVIEFETLKSWINGLAVSSPILNLTKKSFDISGATNSLKIDFTLSKPLTSATTFGLAVDSASSLIENTNYTFNKTVSLAKDATSGSFTINFTNINNLSLKKSLHINFPSSNSVLTFGDSTLSIFALPNSSDIILSDSTISPLLSRKEFIKNKLLSVFKDPNDKAVFDIVDWYLNQYTEMFSQKCDPLEDPFEELSGKSCVGSRLYPFNFKGKDIVYKVIGDWDYNSMINEFNPATSVARSSLLINVCEEILTKPSAVNYSLSRASLTNSSAVNSVNVDKLYKVFNPGYSLTTEESTKVVSTFNEWNNILRLFCIDSKWQVH